MPRYGYRELEPTREAKEVYERWIDFLDREIGKNKKAALREELVLDNLHQLLLGAPKGGRLNFNLNSELPYNVLQLSLDPKNITLEAEYYGDVDEEKYALVKPLIYFWQMFDRSPIAINQWLGLRFRAMLGKHIFKHLGKNVKLFHGIEFSFGYNLTIEDDCVIHRYVILDDRGEIVIKKGTSISDFAAIYSHAHDPVDGSIVENRKTEIGPGARLTYHTAVMAGVSVGKDATIGAMGVATKAVEDESIVGGIPAKEIKKKGDAKRFDGAEEGGEGRAHGA
ncbi:acyltransferase [Acidipila sp. EB88]|uniref:acyltransferase n=1 Tax=Acidipila sp. EB88 TaxID=2305226 RepID=UPI000F5FA643|nr:acyltransferase [Acidipila sp. EB88]RRA47577.1 acyltransferase [Acidipila sp. EB88]